MKKLKLLLLDANIIIKLFELDLWEAVIEKCELLLTSTVIDEAEYYEKNGIKYVIDIKTYIESGNVQEVNVSLSEIRSFLTKFNPTYLDRLDPGEAEALAYLYTSHESCSICSADSIVFRILGRLRMSDKGLSLEEVLQKIGLGRKLTWQYQRDFRNMYTSKGSEDAIQGLGLE